MSDRDDAIAQAKRSNAPVFRPVIESGKIVEVITNRADLVPEMLRFGVRVVKVTLVEQK